MVQASDRRLKRASDGDARITKGVDGVNALSPTMSPRPDSCRGALYVRTTLSVLERW